MEAPKARLKGELHTLLLTPASTERSGRLATFRIVCTSITFTLHHRGSRLAIPDYLDTHTLAHSRGHTYNSRQCTHTISLHIDISPIHTFINTESITHHTYSYTTPLYTLPHLPYIYIHPSHNTATTYIYPSHNTATATIPTPSLPHISRRSPPIYSHHGPSIPSSLPLTLAIACPHSLYSPSFTALPSRPLHAAGPAPTHSSYS